MTNESRTYLESIKKFCESGVYKPIEIAQIIRKILENDRNEQQKEIRQVNKNNRKK